MGAANFGYLDDEPYDGPCPHNRFYRIAGDPMTYCDICDLPAGDNFPSHLPVPAAPAPRHRAIVVLAYLGLVLAMVWAARLA